MAAEDKPTPAAVTVAPAPAMDEPPAYAGNEKGNHDQLSQQQTPAAYGLAGAAEQGQAPVAVMPLRDLDQHPARIACPHCHHMAVTTIDKQDTSAAL